MTSINLKSSISSLELSSCIYNASGPLCTTLEELKNLDNSSSSIVLSKSCTILERQGNPEPRYYHNNTFSINSMGLPNKGYQYYIDCAEEIRKPYFISVGGLTLPNTVDIIRDIISSNKNIKGLEVNLSCPNIVGKGQLAYDLEDMDEYLKTIFNLEGIEKLIIGIKLPPYFDLHWYPLVINILKKYNIKFITCINSIGNGLMIDIDKEQTLIRPKGGMGGIGGSVIKSIGLSNVRNFYLEIQKQNLDIKVIGCGGIERAEDVFEYILCGAEMVQIGTQLYREGRVCFSRINHEFKELMTKKKYINLDDFRGKLNII